MEELLNKKQVWGKHEVRIPTTITLLNNQAAVTTGLTFVESLKNVKISYKITRGNEERIGTLNIVIKGSDHTSSISDNYEETSVSMGGTWAVTHSVSPFSVTLKYTTADLGTTATFVNFVEIIN